MTKVSCPNRGKLEDKLFKQNLILVGCDEVGRGCLAGPVYAAAVTLNYEKLWLLDEKERKLIRDSKTLSARQRQTILPILKIVMNNYAIGISEVREIEEQGIVKATFQAMQRAYAALPVKADRLLIDGNQKNPFIDIEQLAIVGGDNSCFAIAAASILAKEARDQYMREMSSSYPQYNFADNVGYGTKSHLTALNLYGITPLHRKNFAPIHALVNIEQPMSRN